MPARYVTGRDSVFIHAEVSPHDTVRPEPSDLLPALRTAFNRQIARETDSHYSALSGAPAAYPSQAI